MATNTTSKNLDYYMALPYAIHIKPNEDGTWTGEVPQLRGCVTYGDSKEEVLVLIEDAKETWLEACLHYGHPIPEAVYED